MHDEIADMRVVNGPVCGVFPGIEGLGVIGIDADDVERLEIAELYFVQRGKLSSEHEVKQLLPLGALLCGHVSSFPRHAAWKFCRIAR
jgi:hypothetical protein